MCANLYELLLRTSPLRSRRQAQHALHVCVVCMSRPHAQDVCVCVAIICTVYTCTECVIVTLFIGQPTLFVHRENQNHLIAILRMMSWCVFCERKVLSLLDYSLVQLIVAPNTDSDID